ncbi:hypothetical protein ATCV1_z607R [Acanthocystis turfacea chlorella virus 1]|uniref:Uncharacterized protein z607R n=1 Tax=Chlorovirus heliozoae TaxID=322019 RepID=A7K9L7_9PHYC|nr:hypothetical protein ATCV1_z607R [Acanthocystis turfacea chlorella virus 1]ABT16741.1 hypothetical protein ATCV1_z607R [Acanthocystis turfacea chlorella virus 1]
MHWAPRATLLPRSQKACSAPTRPCSPLASPLTCTHSASSCTRSSHGGMPFPRLRAPRKSSAITSALI